MKKLFDLVLYVFTLPIVLVIALFKSSEADRGVSYNSDQAITDSVGMMSGLRDLANKIDTETDKAVAAR